MAKQTFVNKDLFARTAQPEPGPAPPAEPAHEDLETVACRMTPAEKAALLAYADEIGTPYTYLVRWFILDGLRALQSHERERPPQLGPARHHRKRRKQG